MARSLPHLLLDRSSPVPLYFQFAQQLEAAIESGEIGVGDRLDNEIQIAQSLGLSRPTVRRAIQYLVERGLLVRRRGIGTQVVGSQVRRGLELTSLFDDLDASERMPTSRVLSYAVLPAPEPVAAAMGLPAGEPVLTVERLRFAKGEPLALMRNYLETRWLSLVTQDVLERQGLYQVLRGAGVRLRLANQRIGARRATAVEARLLHETRGAALLAMERTAFDDHGLVVEHGSHAYRASRYSFDLTLSA